jgi:hypothetical protein
VKIYFLSTLYFPGPVKKARKNDSVFNGMGGAIHAIVFAKI